MHPTPTPRSRFRCRPAALILLLAIPVTAHGQEDEQLPALIDQLGDRDWKAREKAEAKLLSMGQDAVEALRKALDHPDAEVRWRAESLLEKMRWRVSGEHREAVGDLFEDYDELATDERQFVVEEVVRRLGKEGVDLLMRIGRDDAEAAVRESALLSAEQLGGKEIEEEILGLLKKEGEFWALRWAARLHEKRGETAEALEACRAGRRQNRHDPGHNALYARILLREELWEEALSSLQEMRVDDPENPLYRVLLGKTYEATGREADGAAEYERAMALEPEDGGAYHKLIRTCIEIEKWDLALRAVKNSEAGYPGDPEIQAMRVEIHEAKGDWDSAFRYASFLYQDSEIDTPAHRRWREKIREILERRGEGDLATDDLLDEIHRRAVRVGLWQRLGEIYREKGLHRFATEEIRKALVFKRGHPKLLLQLARVYSEMGESERSSEIAATALAREDLPADVREQLEGLRDGTAPVGATPGVAPLLWEWKVREGEAWGPAPDRNGFPWRIPPVAVGSVVVSAVYGSDTVVGIDGSAGTETWRVDPPEPPPAPEPKKALLDLAWITSDGTAAYLLYNVWQSSPGKFRSTGRKTGLLALAVDPSTGEILRRIDLDSPIDGEPSGTTSDGVIAIPRERGLSGGGIAVVDLVRGEISWSRHFRRLSDLPPRIGGGGVWIALQGGVVIRLDLATGEESWRRDLGSAITAPPAAGEGEIFAATSRGRLFRLDGGTGEPAWEVGIDEIATGMAILPQRRLVLSHHGGPVTCLHADDGALAWRATPGRAAERAFAGTGRTVLCLNGGKNSFWPERTEVIDLDANDGEVRWRFEAGLRANLVLHGDRAVLADGDLDRGFRLAGLSASEGELGPDLIARVLRMEAAVRAEDGEREVAVAIIGRALSLAEQPGLYLDLARIRRKERRYDDAKAALEKGKALPGADGHAFESLMEEIEAEIEARKARQEEIEEETRKAREEAEKGEDPGGEGDDPPGEDAPGG